VKKVFRLFLLLGFPFVCGQAYGLDDVSSAAKDNANKDTFNFETQTEVLIFMEENKRDQSRIGDLAKWAVKNFRQEILELLFTKGHLFPNTFFSSDVYKAAASAGNIDALDYMTKNAIVKTDWLGFQSDVQLNCGNIDAKNWIQQKFGPDDSSRKRRGRVESGGDVKYFETAKQQENRRKRLKANNANNASENNSDLDAELLLSLSASSQSLGAAASSSVSSSSADCVAADKGGDGDMVIDLTKSPSSVMPVPAAAASSPSVLMRPSSAAQSLGATSPLAVSSIFSANSQNPDMYLLPASSLAPSSVPSSGGGNNTAAHNSSTVQQQEAAQNSQRERDRLLANQHQQLLQMRERLRFQLHQEQLQQEQLHQQKKYMQGLSGNAATSSPAVVASVVLPSLFSPPAAAALVIPAPASSSDALPVALTHDAFRELFLQQQHARLKNYHNKKTTEGQNVAGFVRGRIGTEAAAASSSVPAPTSSSAALRAAPSSTAASRTATTSSSVPAPTSSSVPAPTSSSAVAPRTATTSSMAAASSSSAAALRAAPSSTAVSSSTSSAAVVSSSSPVALSSYFFQSIEGILVRFADNDNMDLSVAWKALGHETTPEIVRLFLDKSNDLIKNYTEVLNILGNYKMKGFAGHYHYYNYSNHLKICTAQASSDMIFSERKLNRFVDTKSLQAYLAAYKPEMALVKQMGQHFEKRILNLQSLGVLLYSRDKLKNGLFSLDYELNQGEIDFNFKCLAGRAMLSQIGSVKSLLEKLKPQVKAQLLASGERYLKLHGDISKVLTQYTKMPNVPYFPDSLYIHSVTSIQHQINASLYGQVNSIDPSLSAIVDFIEVSPPDTSCIKECGRLLEHKKSAIRYVLGLLRHSSLTGGLSGGESAAAFDLAAPSVYVQQDYNGDSNARDRNYRIKHNVPATSSNHPAMASAASSTSSPIVLPKDQKEIDRGFEKIIQARDCKKFSHILTLREVFTPKLKEKLIGSAGGLLKMYHDILVTLSKDVKSYPHSIPEIMKKTEMMSDVMLKSLLLFENKSPKLFSDILSFIVPSQSGLDYCKRFLKERIVAIHNALNILNVAKPHDVHNGELGAVNALEFWDFMHQGFCEVTKNTETISQKVKTFSPWQREEFINQVELIRKKYVAAKEVLTNNIATPNARVDVTLPGLDGHISSALNNIIESEDMCFESLKSFIASKQPTVEVVKKGIVTLDNKIAQFDNALKVLRAGEKSAAGSDAAAASAVAPLGRVASSASSSSGRVTSSAAIASSPFVASARFVPTAERFVPAAAVVPAVLPALQQSASAAAASSVSASSVVVSSAPVSYPAASSSPTSSVPPLLRLL